MEKNKILQTKNLVKKFKQNDRDMLILDNISIDVFEGEIIGIIGRSGSGKSTFLRLISHLLEPTSGEILYHDRPLPEMDAKISMIFQGFGLVPWLTVFDNIALGLDRKKLSKAAIQDKVEKAVNLVGLKGYEEAYPKEMSGGMRQRVGFARALVVDPEILLMDEAFSALDYLTSEALKEDLLDLWFERNISSLKSIILVTHSIEEAVYLCDRVIILSSNPGRIVGNVVIDMPHPRDRNSQKFHAITAGLYAAMADTQTAHNEQEANHNFHKFYPQLISVIHMVHFMETVQKHTKTGPLSLEILSRELGLHNERMIMFVESLILLKFIEVENHRISLTSAGHILIDADESSQKTIFRAHLVNHVSFVGQIYARFQDNPELVIPKSDLLSMLEQKFDSQESLNILTAFISWARYADLFSYNDIKEELCLDPNFHLSGHSAQVPVEKV